jgi:hypothetical protein
MPVYYLEIVEATVRSPLGDFISYSVTTVAQNRLISHPELLHVYGRTPQEFLATREVDFYVYDQVNDVHYGSREIPN